MAGKKIILTESMFNQLVLEEAASKVDIDSLVKSKEFKDAVYKAVKDNRDVEKDIEKTVRKLVTNIMKDLLRGMWERSNLWTNIINK